MNNPTDHSCRHAESSIFNRAWAWSFGLLILAWVGIWGAQQADWSAWFSSLELLTERLLPGLRLVDENSPIAWVTLPAVLVVVWAASMPLLFDRPPDWLRLPIALTFVLLQLGYLSFRLVFTLSLDTWADGIVSVLFLVSEAFIHFRIALGNLSLVSLTDRSAEADLSQQAVRAGQYLPSVDVFIPTYSEPVEMLRRTIIGCQAMDYPRKTVYLLDDQRRPEMRQLAKELGCRYFERPDNLHAKAGNLNHALDRTDGELVLCFDADFVPVRNFLERTVGFFRDPAVAMVQTPQNFFNEDAVTRNLGLENALEDEQRLFFRTLQPGRDAMNAIVCHGSCFVARRSALERIGGIPTETITEDWATSIKLQAAGYKLLYLNEALSAGMSADRCGEFVQQRSRWAQGTLQALFARTNPFTIPGLNWKQRLMHASAMVYYLGSLASLFSLVAPLFYLFFGAHLLRMTVAEIVFYRVPFTIGFYLLYSWLTRRTRSALWTEFYEAFLAPSMALTVLKTFWNPFGAGFRVTDKTVRQQRIQVNRRVALPFALLFALHLAGIGCALALQRPLEEPDAFAIATYFAVSNLVTLWLCLLVSIDVAQETRDIRFEHRLDCRLFWDGMQLAGETTTLSEETAVVRLAAAPTRLPETAFLDIESLPCPLRHVPVRVRTSQSHGQVTLEYSQLALVQRRALVGLLFCRPRQWDRPPRSEARAVWEYLRAGLRIYPLAESP